MKKILLACFILLFTTSVNAQTSRLTGDWQGFIAGPRGDLNITLHFVQKDDTLTGTIDIQGATLPLQKISVASRDSVFFEFHTTVNVAKFKGVFKNDSTINGQYYQAGYSFSFKLSQGKMKAASVTNQAPIPYHYKDLIIQNDSIAIAGTLTWPEDQSAKQLVIVISGSGVQNRDGATPLTDFEPYAKLANGLTQKGIAVFRYDDRGVGHSTGNYGSTTIAMLADDVKAIINYFSLSHDSVPTYSNIILLGHSQGGIVAGIAATETNAVDRLILMSSPGLPLKVISRYQVRQELKKTLTKEEIDAEFAARDHLIAALQKDKEIEKAKKKYHKHSLKFLKALYGSTDRNFKKLARKKTRKMVAMYQSDILSSLLFYNPVNDLKQLTIPVLVLFGGKDTQVPVEMNKPPVKQALEKAGVAYRIKVFPEANHLYQNAKTGSFREYNSLKSQFVNGLIPTIAQWIKQ